MKFFYEITPKKRGNWRPKISIAFSIDADEVAHRPYFSDVILASGALGKKYNINKSLWRDDAVVIELKEKHRYADQEEWALYTSPERGDAHVHTNSPCRDFSYIRITLESFVDRPLSNTFSFYGPWKAGKNPDYSEILPVIMEIRDTIRIMQTNGLEHESNIAMRGSMSSIGTRDEWIGTGTHFSAEEFAKENQYGDCGYRNLDLD